MSGTPSCSWGRAGTRTPTGSSASLIGLRGSIGNAAVVQRMRRAGVAREEQEHRHESGCGHGGSAQAPVQRSSVHDVLRGRGRPLDRSTRADMESRLDADFSDVRIHDDRSAKNSASEIGARAYTSGSHVVLGEGGRDKETLAHELTHVIQQRQGPVSGTDNGSGLRASDPSDRFEREAEANVRRVMSAGHACRCGRGGPAGLGAADGGPYGGRPADAEGTEGEDRRQEETGGLNATEKIYGGSQRERSLDREQDPPARAGTVHRTLLWLLVSDAAVLSARSPQWASALTRAAAVHSLAAPDRRKPTMTRTPPTATERALNAEVSRCGLTTTRRQAHSEMIS